MSNPLLQDLADAAGYVMRDALSSLPDELLRAVGDAHAQGGEIEIRVRAGSPARISLWLLSPSEATLLAQIAG